MTIWQDVGAEYGTTAGVSKWVEGQMDRELPPAYALLPVADQVERATAAVRRHAVDGYVGTESSGIRIVAEQQDDDYLMHAGLTMAIDLDPQREWFRWEDLSEEERPRHFVVDEVVSSLDGLPCLGPGGRLTISRFHNERAVLDLVVRPKEDILPSRWRNPQLVAAAAVTMSASSPSDIRLRARLGYEEASGLERQTVLRPVFVFLLDRPMAESGPRWRVAVAVPATAIDGEADSGDGDGTTIGADNHGCV